MAGAACKVIINQGLRGLIEGIERVLIDPAVHQDRIPEKEREELIQRLADVDLASYSGQGMPEGGAAGILLALEKWNVVTPEVWEVFKRPVVEA